MANGQTERLEGSLEDYLVQSLPPLPSTASELLAILADEHAPTIKLVQLIEEDVALAARLVGLANSSFYALPQPVVSVQDAVLRVLGLDVARGVVLSAIAGATLDYHQCEGFQVERFWRESLLVASLSRSLCLSSSGTLGDHAARGYLAGLLMRLGLLGLAALRPEETAKALAADPERSLGERLKAELGVTHREVGGAIARHWHLPEPIPTLVADAAPAETRSLAGLLSASVSLAANMAAHEIYVSSRSLSSQAANDPAIEQLEELGGMVESVQSECSKLHQQAQTIAATL